MKAILLAVLWPLLTDTAEWMTDISKAQEIAKSENRLILLNFSGSDWCAPCVRLKKEVFASARFEEVAAKQLVLVNADFPRNKKNQLSKTQQQLNETLADKYNSGGKFPFTLLLRADGTVIHSWEGFPAGGNEIFINELEKLCTSNLPK